MGQANQNKHAGLPHSHTQEAQWPPQEPAQEPGNKPAKPPKPGHKTKGKPTAHTATNPSPGTPHSNPTAPKQTTSRHGHTAATTRSKTYASFAGAATKNAAEQHNNKRANKLAKNGATSKPNPAGKTQWGCAPPRPGQVPPRR
nr:MAG TPA: hypothetical protein [Caudoviricetes sp.]